MSKVSESIFSGKVGIEHVVIPMADVQWVEYEEWGGNKKVYKVMMKTEFVTLKHFMGEKFMRAWLDYRYEVEGGKESLITMPD